MTNVIDKEPLKIHAHISGARKCQNLNFLISVCNKLPLVWLESCPHFPIQVRKSPGCGFPTWYFCLPWNMFLCNQSRLKHLFSIEFSSFFLKKIKWIFTPSLSVVKISQLISWRDTFCYFFQASFVRENFKQKCISFYFLFLNFTILYWFCQVSKWICHRYTCVPHPEPSSLLPPHTIPLGRPSAPAPSIQYHALNLDWRLVPYKILYVFQILEKSYIKKHFKA